MVVQALWRAKKKDGLDMLKTKEIVDRTFLPQSTVIRIMEDMNLLRLVKRMEVNGDYFWQMSPNLEMLATKSCAFTKIIPVRKDGSM